MGRVGDDDAARDLGREAADRLRHHAAHRATHHEGGRLADGAQQFDNVAREIVEAEAGRGRVAVPMAAEVRRDQSAFALEFGDYAVPEGAAQSNRVQKNDGASRAPGAIGDRQAIAQSETHGQPFLRGPGRRAGPVRPPGGMCCL